MSEVNDGASRSQSIRIGPIDPDGSLLTKKFDQDGPQLTKKNLTPLVWLPLCSAQVSGVSYTLPEIENKHASPANVSPVDSKQAELGVTALSLHFDF